MAAALGAAIWWLSRRRYTPNRSAAQAKADLGRRAERDSVARIREQHDRREKQISQTSKRVRHKLSESCQRTRARASAEVRELRERERERINAKADAIRGNARSKCRKRRERVRELLAESRQLAREERDEKIRVARQIRADQRRQDRRLAAKTSRRAKKEARRESDDEVEHNIDPELVPVWRQIKGDMRSTAKMSRTEAFMHWVQENEGEMWAMREDAIADELSGLAEQEAAYYRQHA